MIQLLTRPRQQFISSEAYPSEHTTFRLANVNGDTSWDTIKQLGDVAETFGKVDFDTTSQTWLDTATDAYKTLSSQTSASDLVKVTPEVVKQISAATQDLIKGINQLTTALRTRQVPENQIQQELDRLKTADPAFTDLAAQVQDVMREKKMLGDQLASTVQATGGLAPVGNH